MKYLKTGLLILFVVLVVLFSPCFFCTRPASHLSDKCGIDFDDIEYYINSDKGVIKTKLGCDDQHNINADVVGITFYSNFEFFRLTNFLGVCIIFSYKVQNCRVYECSGAFGFNHCQIVEYDDVLKVGIPYIYDSF